jgi:hypothetical protein
MKKLAAAFACVVVLGAGVSASAAPKVRTLVSADSRITAFAQNGSFVAWAAADRKCFAVVRLRDLSRGKTSLLTRLGTSGCKMTARVAQLAVAASGTGARVLWTRYETGNNVYHWLYAASSGHPTERQVGLVSESTADELWVSLAGSGSFLGYGWAHATEDLDANLPYTILDGGVKRVGDDLSLSTTPGLPPAAMLAAGGGRVALVPRGDLHATTRPRPELREIEIRSATTLALIARVTTGSPIQSVAISSTTLAAHVTKAVETYDLSGKLLSRKTVPYNASRPIAVARSRVAYSVGNWIYLVGRSRPVAAATSAPIGLSAVGPRLAWAENANGRGRIRALTLP